MVDRTSYGLLNDSDQLPRKNVLSYIVPNLLCAINAVYNCFFAVPLLTLFIMGSVYINDCHVQNEIPILLIVIGSVGLIIIPLRIVMACLCFPRKMSHMRSLILALSEIVFLFIHIIVIIPFNVFVFQGWHKWNDNGQMSCPVDDPNITNCCNPGFMYFSYSFVYILDAVGIILIVIIAIFCIHRCSSIRKSNELSPEYYGNNLSGERTPIHSI
jgi:hypothetical protein